MSFWEHADELGRRFKIVLVVFIIATAIGWLPTNLAGILNPIGGCQPLLSLVMQRVKTDFLPSQATLIAGGMADTVFVYGYLSILVGLLLTSPVIVYEIYAFIKPALYSNERKFLVSYVGSFIGLLTLGTVMAYFLIIPISFRILIYFTITGGAVPFIFIKDFYNWILTIFAIWNILHNSPLHSDSGPNWDLTGAVPKGKKQDICLRHHFDGVLGLRSRPHSIDRRNHDGTIRSRLRNCGFLRKKNRQSKTTKEGWNVWNAFEQFQAVSKPILQILPRRSRRDKIEFLPTMPQID
jgi:Sec-independent protein secretion pathway component TatC